MNYQDRFGLILFIDTVSYGLYIWLTLVYFRLDTTPFQAGVPYSVVTSLSHKYLLNVFKNAMQYYTKEKCTYTYQRF